MGGLCAVISVMLNLARYLAIAGVGIWVGSRPRVRSRPLAVVDRMQFFALMLMISALGIKLGADEQVFASLGQLGLAALLLTLAAMGGALLCVTLLRRFVLRLDRRGRASNESAQEVTGGGGKADNALTYWITGTVAAGILTGRFLIPPGLAVWCGYGIDWGLYLLLFFAGLDMGRKGTLLEDIQKIGWQALGVPAAGVAGSLAGAVLIAPLTGLSLRDGMAAVAGFSWYSLAPNLLASYSLSLSAVCFLSNVMREIFSVLAMPLVAKHIGYVECTVLPGAAAMDSMLPVVLRATNQRTGIYSILSGVVHSCLVPVLVPALIAL